MTEPAMEVSTVPEFTAAFSPRKEESDTTVHDNLNLLPVLLVPLDVMYYAVHTTAIITQIISFCCSLCVIIWQGKKVGWNSIWQKKQSERLVLYLAINDMIYSLSHCCDHLLVMAASGRVILAKACIFFGGVLTALVCTQTVMVFLHALNALVLVAFNKRINFGKYDLGFLLITYGFPVPVIAWFIAKEYFGYSGYWCFMDALNPIAWKMGQTFGIVHCLSSVAIILMYATLAGVVWRSHRTLWKFSEEEPKVGKMVTDSMTVSESTKRENISQEAAADAVKTDEIDIKEDSISAVRPISDDIKEDSISAVRPISEVRPISIISNSIPSEPQINKQEKTKKKANKPVTKVPYVQVLKVSSLFVVAYIAQWWPSIIFYGIAPFVSDIGTWYVMTLAIFPNLGGVFNMLAYSLLRKVITNR